MQALTIIITCKFIPGLEVHEKNFCYYMRKGAMENAHGSYNHGEEIKGLYINMGNVETSSNGRRGTQDPITMRNLQREV